MKIILCFTVLIQIIKITFSYKSLPIILNTNKEITFPVNSTCLELTINNMYQNIDFNIRLASISKFLISNKRIDDFINLNDIPKCHSESDICLEYILPNEIKYLNNYCTHSLFLYACADSNDISNARVNITNSVNKVNGCRPIEKNIDSNCASLGSNCINIDKCSNKCEYLNCKGDTNEYNLCVPLSTPEKRKEICSLFGRKVSSFSTRNCVPSRINDTNFDEVLQPKDTRLYKLFAVIIGVIIFGIIMSSFYYRLKLKEYGVPPFEPPSYMPGFIYPRQDKGDKFLSRQ